MKAFSALLLRELRLGFRRPAELANPLLFFALVIGLFPLALGPQSELLQELSGGLLWLAALLAVLLSLDGLFRSDHEDGSLEALMLLAPLLALMLGLPGRCVPVLMLSLLLGTPVLSLLGAVGAALTLSIKRGGLLLSLLILPLYIPLLILGSGAVQADLQGLPVSGQLLLLASLCVLALALCPFAIAAALSISLSQ